MLTSLRTASTRVLLLVASCAALYGALGPGALPGSEVFALSALALAAFVGGWMAGSSRLPPLVGMLAAGILFRNLPCVPYGKDISTKWASTIRSTALSIILLKAGLGLEPSRLRVLGPTVTALSFVPCLAEAGALAAVTRLLLGMPWIWATMLGFIVSAVSAAVLVPGALKLAEEGRGRGVPTLLMAAVSLDNVAALTGFLVAMNVLISGATSEELVMTLLKRLLEPVAGLALGAAFGILLWYLPDEKMASERPSLSYVRCSLLCLSGLSFTLVSQRMGLSGIGALACVSLAFCASLRWRRDQPLFKSISRITGNLWWFLEPFLFGLVGNEVTFKSLESNAGSGLLVLVCGLSVRMVSTAVSLLGSGLDLKEKLFVSVSWMSKATVQAAVGSQALDYARTHNKGTEFEDLGKQVLAISVLSIILTAPLGAVLMDFLGPRLLKKESILTPEEKGRCIPDSIKPTAPSYGSCT